MRARRGTTLGLAFAIGGAFCNAGSVIQTRRLTETETTSSIVFYFSLICALAGLATWPLGWLMPTWPEFAALVTVGLCGGLAHILLTESYRLAPASVVAPFDYTVDGMGVSARIFLLQRTADDVRLRRRRDHRGRGAVRDLAGAPARRCSACARPKDRPPVRRAYMTHGTDNTDGSGGRQPSLFDLVLRQNALKVMMVRVSWMPGMVCTFSLTKWPMSVLSST